MSLHHDRSAASIAQTYTPKKPPEQIDIASPETANGKQGITRLTAQGFSAITMFA